MCHKPIFEHVETSKRLGRVGEGDERFVLRGKRKKERSRAEVEAESGRELGPH